MMKDPYVFDFISMRDMTKLMGVSAYQLTRELPEMLRDALPSGKDFERL